MAKFLFEFAGIGIGNSSKVLKCDPEPLGGRIFRDPTLDHISGWQARPTFGTSLMCGHEPAGGSHIS